MEKQVDQRDTKAALDGLIGRYGEATFADGVVFVQIPQVPPSAVRSDVARNLGYFAYPPQGLLYLATVCDGIGLPARIVDLNNVVITAGQETDALADLDQAWRQALERAIGELGAPVIGVSFMFDSTRGQLNQVLAYIRDNHPGLFIMVGGVAATADPEAILATGHADMVVHNEGEKAFADFFAYVRDSSNALPDNLSMLDDDGLLRSTRIVNGGEVDMDIRRQYARIDIGGYNKAGSLNNFSRMRGTGVPFATVLSRRGCRAHCTFCAVRNFNGRSVRVRDAESVVEEMVHLWERHGVRHFEWLDDDLLYDRGNALELFRLIARRLPGATWCANNGLIAAAVSDEMLQAMQDSGCRGFTVGLETGNPEMLRQVRKPASLETFAAFAERTKAYPKIHYIVNFILGLPDERFGQMLDSLAVGMSAGLDWMNLFNYQPLRNTDAYLAYGGMDARPDESVTERGTTVNFNPIREGAFKDAGDSKGLLTGYDVFDLDVSTVPGREQVNEIWFTFNSICNFARLPAVYSPSRPRLRNAVKWLEGLQQAYADNPTITCLLYFLSWRLNERPGEDIEKIRMSALRKFKNQEYWRKRDEDFKIAAFLDREIPPLDKRAEAFLDSRGVSFADAPQDLSDEEQEE